MIYDGQQGKASIQNFLAKSATRKYSGKLHDNGAKTHVGLVSMNNSIMMIPENAILGSLIVLWSCIEESFALIEVARR